MDGLSSSSDSDEPAMEVAEESPPTPPSQPMAVDDPASSKSSDEDEDDDDVQRPTQAQSRSREASPAIFGGDDNEDDDDDDESDLSQSQARRAPPAPVITRHEIEMPAARPKLAPERQKPDLYHVKLPNFLSIGTHEYDPLHYEDEIDDEEERDYEGRAKLKLKVENTIRWRKFKESDGSDKIESNTRLVEWSDGTKSLYLGSEVFDVNVKPVGESSQLYIRLGQAAGLQAQAIFQSKLSIRPNSTESSTHRKLTLSLADRSQKTQKIKIWNNYGEDPEVKLQKLVKSEDEKLKATMRRETKQRRLQERSQSSGPSAQYLEDYDEEDDDGSISLSAIKRNTLARRDRDYSDDEEESEEEDNSDDSDPEFGKDRRTERKKKQVVEDSDEDD